MRGDVTMALSAFQNPNSAFCELIQQKTSQVLGQMLIAGVRITVTLREGSIQPNYQKEANLTGFSLSC